SKRNKRNIEIIEELADKQAPMIFLFIQNFFNSFYCPINQLKDVGVLAHDTHETVIRFAPPIIITNEQIDWAIERIKKVLDK
ncbi:MAG: aminotransferase class III-fold pyridoxal phosphate-dependent enzyme, partial [Bacillota bacterium]|nr:aminotransferase class III-fold pyridoxal phosphate-dependent enzyme [Bacillota bacterium]